MLLDLTGPALAAEFYIVQDTATKTCAIIDEKPATQTNRRATARSMRPEPRPD